MIVVGVAFGAAHGLVEALLVLVPFGIALAWLRDRTNSVIPGMIVHGALQRHRARRSRARLAGQSSSSSSPSSTAN